MICQFSFKNFKSYKDETVFDFQAANLPEFKDSLLGTSKPLLPVNVIYGSNGGGKSNLLKAFSCLVSIVVRPIYDLRKNQISFIQQRIGDLTCEPFLLDEGSKDQPTEFNVFFRIGGSEYRYYIALLKEQITSESLSRRTLKGKRTAVLFEREGSRITLGMSISKKSINRDVNSKMPYLSFLAINYDLPVIAEVQRWFESVIIWNDAGTKFDPGTMFTEDPVLKKELIRSMNDMGIDIHDYRIDRETNRLWIQRKINKRKYELSFDDESAGTKKLLISLPVLLPALAEGRLVIIDELDSKLHPKLLRYIIFLFTNKEINKKGAQMVFTSHDMATMRNDVFRRDEIWFAALNEDHASEIYSLYEIRRENGMRINHTAAYARQYLEGRYGADPYLRNMLSWEETE